MTEPVDPGEIADALYGLPHAEFIAARDQYVKAAKAGGEPALAAAISKLRRPTAAAWLINQLARDQPDQIAELADLGTRLRAAHREMDGVAIRELSRERQALMGAVVGLSRDLGRREGQPASESTVRELEDMFTAALADPDAANALASGRLASAKDLLTGVTSWPASDPSAEAVTDPSAEAVTQLVTGDSCARERPREPGDAVDRPANDAGGTRAAGADARPATVADLATARLSKARAELMRVDIELEKAELAAKEAQDAADTATDAETDARKAVTRLRTELSNAEHAEKEAREGARAARRAHDDAERTVREARKRRDVAANRLAALGDEP